MPASVKARVAVSYSWKEEREGQNKGAVQAFTDLLTASGIEVVRDVDELKHGECISEFMRTIGASDFLCVFLSDSYLRSPNCMYELLVAWQRSKDNATEFRKRVKAWVMPGLNGIGKRSGRAPYIDHWTKEHKEIAADVKKRATSGLAPASLKEFNLTKEIAANVDAILQFFGDTLSPGTLGDYQSWIQTCFPNACSSETSPDVTDVYENVVREMNQIVQRNSTVREFLNSAAPGLIQQQGAESKMAASAASGTIDLVDVLKGICGNLDTFSGSRSDWSNLGDLCGGLVVLGISPQWVASQRENARADSAIFPGDGETVRVGDGREANLLHLVARALADGRARLEMVFGKPAIDDRRVPEPAHVLRGITEADQLHEIKLHFIRFVLGADVSLDEADQGSVDRKFLQTTRIITAAWEDDHDPFFAAAPSFRQLKETIRTKLKMEDLLLIHPGNEDPDLLLTDNVRVVRFLGKIFDAVQANIAP